MRLEFVQLALQPKSNIRQLCQRFNISPPTGYKWIERFREQGADGLVDLSRRPHSSPNKTAEELEKVILALHDKHPSWGGRKLRNRLVQLGAGTLPVVSTFTEVLRRNGRILPSVEHPGPLKRFARLQANQLWQMDFKGEFRTQEGWCYPLTVVDDCTRYALCIAACSNQRTATVKEHLTRLFQRYGLPDAILTDNGSPWGSSDPLCKYTTLGVWLLQLGVQLLHGRPYHPQTQGKIERFHKTLKAEVLNRKVLLNLAMCQEAFDEWRPIYNYERSHESLGDAVPRDCYQVSSRTFPEKLEEPEYLDTDHIRRVKSKGEITFQNQFYYVGRAFYGKEVAMRPTRRNGIYEVFYGPFKVGRIDTAIPDTPKSKYLSIRDDNPPFCFSEEQ